MDNGKLLYEGYGNVCIVQEVLPYSSHPQLALTGRAKTLAYDDFGGFYMLIVLYYFIHQPLYIMTLRVDKKETEGASDKPSLA